MRLAHFSDSHLGHMRYNKVVPETGVNQREQDVYDAFERAVDGILAAEPDVVVHTGDLFDSPRPANRAVYHAVRQIRRLVERGLPLVLISGNHSTPRLRATVSLFALLGEFVPGVKAAYRGEYEKLEVGEVAFHAIPHCFTNEELEAQLARVAPDPRARYNVALLHVGIQGFREFRLTEANELLLHESNLPAGMDYICLGHYHKHVKVAEGAWYAGSLERFSFAEAGDAKGFCVVDLDQRQPVFHPVATRPMVDLDPVEAEGMDGPALLEAIQRRLASQPLDGAMVRLRVRNCSPAAQRNLDLRPIREQVSAALSFEFKWEREGDTGTTESVESMAFKSPEEEWRLFMQSAEVHGRDRELLARKGLEYLAAARAEEQPDAADLAGTGELS